MSGSVQNPAAGDGPFFSLIIPYRQRLANIELVFESLAEQTLGRECFEVVLGVMEYCEDYVALCKRFTDRLDLVSVLTGHDWQVSRARNLALRQASGQVAVLLDADMLLPSNFLENLRDRHFSGDRNACVIGQMIDYDNNTQDVTTVSVRPFAEYRQKLRELQSQDEVRADARIHVPHVIPWAFAWTALLALPMQTVRRHDLWFDLTFHGYGAEDLEWAYRVAATGTPIGMAADVYGIHLPHVRNIAANQGTEERNYRRFLDLHPDLDVELAGAFGDFAANEMQPEYRGRIAQAVGDTPHGAGLAVLQGRTGHELWLVVGAVTDADGTVLDETATGLFDTDQDVRVLPIAGLAMPWEDGAVQECRVLPAALRLGGRFTQRVLSEAERVARKVTLPHPGENSV
ncbi:MAG: hypothetical protein QG608_1155 [Actinomycetota bacterium]|nr:hypothetical protein [Actinomycetota bacterium]